MGPQVLLAADSPDAIEWAEKQTDFNWHYLDIDRSAFGEPGAGHAARAGKDLKPLSSTDVESVTHELRLLSYGHIMVGSFCSHITNAAYYMIAGRLNTAPPYVSMDGCGLRMADSEKTLAEDMIAFSSGPSRAHNPRADLLNVRRVLLCLSDGSLSVFSSVH